MAGPRYIKKKLDVLTILKLNYKEQEWNHKQVAVGLDEEVTTYTCIGAIIFAIVGGIDRLLLIALTAYSFSLCKKAKTKE